MRVENSCAKLDKWYKKLQNMPGPAVERREN